MDIREGMREERESCRKKREKERENMVYLEKNQDLKGEGYWV